jgi:hypothetical protein
MVSARPEPPAQAAESSAGVRYGKEAFAFCTGETLTNWHLIDPKSNAGSPSLAPFDPVLGNQRDANATALRIAAPGCSAFMYPINPKSYSSTEIFRETLCHCQSSAKLLVFHQIR